MLTAAASWKALALAILLTLGVCSLWEMPTPDRVGLLPPESIQIERVQQAEAPAWASQP